MVRSACACGLLWAALAAAQPRGQLKVPVQKSGKVTMEDGSPPPETVIVEAFCGGAAGVPVARTDSKGGFIVGRGRDGEVDARLQRGAVAAPGNLAGCALEARLPGYRSTTIRVVDSEVIDIGAIVLQRPAGVEGTLYSGTSRGAPKEAQRAWEKAAAAAEKKKWDQARPLLEKAVGLYPAYAAAWFDLGRVHQASGDLTQARAAFERSIKADPKFVKPYLSLAGLLHQEKNWRAAADVSAELIRLDPSGFAGAYLINAISNLRLGNGAAAEASARQAIQLDTAHVFPEAEYALGLLLGERGANAEAVEHLRNYLRLVPDSPGAEGVKKMVAELEGRK